MKKKDNMNSKEIKNEIYRVKKDSWIILLVPYMILIILISTAVVRCWLTRLTVVVPSALVVAWHFFS